MRELNERESLINEKIKKYRQNNQNKTDYYYYDGAKRKHLLGSLTNDNDFNDHTNLYEKEEIVNLLVETNDLETFENGLEFFKLLNSSQKRSKDELSALGFESKLSTIPSYNLTLSNIALGRFTEENILEKITKIKITKKESKETNFTKTSYYLEDGIMKFFLGEKTCEYCAQDNNLYRINNVDLTLAFGAIVLAVVQISNDPETVKNGYECLEISSIFPLENKELNAKRPNRR